VAEAVLRIGKKVLKNAALTSLAALAFIAIYLLKIPFPVIVLSAGVIGYIGSRIPLAVRDSSSLRSSSFSSSYSAFRPDRNF
jgi:chromate transport protein ChrA